MAELVSEITFVGMSPRSGTKSSPSATNLPGWKLMSAAIKDAIAASGLSVQVIAGRSGVARQYIYLMMKGDCNPTIDVIESVMKAAGASLADWLTDKSTYGRDKRIHDQVQLILNQKGVSAIALRQSIAGLLSLKANHEENT